MKENTISVVINRPISEVFEFTTNPSNTHVWISTIIREEVDKLPIKKGTIYRNVGSSGNWTEYTVVKFRKDKIFELKQKDGTYSVRYTYKKISADKTQLTYFEWVNEGELENPFSVKVLGNLKKIMEAKK